MVGERKTLERTVMRAALPMLLALAISGCDQVAPSGPPVEIQPSQAEAMLHQTTDLDGKRVAIEGYVFFDNGQRGEAIAMGPELRSSPNGGGEPLARFEMAYGPGPNQLDLHEVSKERPGGIPEAPEILTFDLAQVTWQDAAGASHPLSQKVRLTGTVRYAGFKRSGPVSKDDAGSPTGKRYWPMLKKVVLDVPAH
jgi:hypothetical protein